MTVLVFGQTGQVSTELRRLATVTALGRDKADLTDPASCVRAIEVHAPAVVINAAAYTTVDRAEDEEEQALRVNGDAPTAMATACASLGIPFIHISSDYVFDGSGSQPWHPNDNPLPQNAYGRSKLAGEQGIAVAGGTYAILRTSWVFSSHRTNFVKSMLHLSKTRDVLNIVADQIGGPTPARAIAAASLLIAEQLKHDPEKSGVYHFSGTPDVSWHDFAASIFNRASRDVSLTPILSSDYPTSASRPLNSRLDCTTTTHVFGIARPDWRDGLDDVLNELGVR